jgi:hypothetical protein
MLDETKPWSKVCAPISADFAPEWNRLKPTHSSHILSSSFNALLIDARSNVRQYCSGRALKHGKPRGFVAS